MATSAWSNAAKISQRVLKANPPPTTASKSNANLIRLTGPGQPTQQMYPSSAPQGSWNITGWQLAPAGSGQVWAQQPILTVNGRQYRFETPQEYIQMLGQLQQQGYSNVGNTLAQMQTGQQYYTQQIVPQQQIRAQQMANEQANNEQLAEARKKSIAENIRIQTGDPEVDALLNTYLDEIWGNFQQLFDNLPGPLTAEDTQKMEAEVERIFGPSLARLKQTTEDYFGKQLGLARENRGLAEEGLTRTLTRGQEDVTTAGKQLAEDVTRQERILGRNLQEAQKDVALSYANAGRAVSGRRLEAEGKVQTAYAEDAELLRLLSDREKMRLTTGQQRLGEDVDVQRRGLDVQERGLLADIDYQKQQQQQKIDQFKAEALSGKMLQAQTTPYELLPGLLSQPDFAKITPDYNVTTPTQPQYAGGLPKLASSAPSSSAWDVARSLTQRVLSGSPTNPLKQPAASPSITTTTPVSTQMPPSTTNIRSISATPSKPADLSTREYDLYLKRLKNKGLIR